MVSTPSQIVQKTFTGLIGYELCRDTKIQIYQIQSRLQADDNLTKNMVITVKNNHIHK